MSKAKIKGIIYACAIMLLFASLIVFFGISEVQYARLTENMLETPATITDVEYEIGRKGYVQEIKVTYLVNDTVYTRELGTDTVISFEAGAYGDVQIGDTVSILYNPQNPNEIASPRTSSIGLWVCIISALGLAFFAFVLVLIIKGKSKERSGSETPQIHQHHRGECDMTFDFDSLSKEFKTFYEAFAPETYGASMGRAAEHAVVDFDALSDKEKALVNEWFLELFGEEKEYYGIPYLQVVEKLRDARFLPLIKSYYKRLNMRHSKIATTYLHGQVFRARSNFSSDLALCKKIIKELKSKKK